MADNFDVEIIDDGLQRKINALIKASQSQAMFKTIGTTVANRIRLCFRLGVDPWGNPWAPLKIRKGQPLVNRGIMRRSITSKADNTGVTVGTNLKNEGVNYPAVHQFGATIVPKKKGGMLAFPGANGNIIFSKGVTIPKRSFMPIRSPGAQAALPPAWSVAVVRSLRNYFKKATDGA